MTATCWITPSLLYGSNAGNSNLHNHYPLPTALVGGWKTIKGGQHLKYPDQTPLANMLLTVLGRAGVLSHFGDSSGKFRSAMREAPSLSALLIAPLFSQSASGGVSLIDLVKAGNQQAALALIDQKVNVNLQPNVGRHPPRCIGPRTMATSNWSTACSGSADAA